MMKRMDNTRYGIDAAFAPNKSLGQNFLTDPAAIRDIVSAAAIEHQSVLEIGPGTGALTQALLERAKSVTAIEKDGRLCEALRARFGEKLKLVHGDALDVDVATLMGHAPWHAVSNLPYYATTPIVLRLITLLPASMTLMVQREAAERFSAKPSERVYGAIAILTARYYVCSVVRDVPRGCFWPQPDVDSRVVRLVKRADASHDAAAFSAFLKKAFAMRRKTLINNLSRAAYVYDALKQCGLSASVRAEAIDPETLYRLFCLINER